MHAKWVSVVDHITRVEALIQDNRQGKLCDIVVELDFPNIAVHKIIYEKMGSHLVSSSRNYPQITSNLTPYYS